MTITPWEDAGIHSGPENLLIMVQPVCKGDLTSLASADATGAHRQNLREKEVSRKMGTAQSTACPHVGFLRQVQPCS